MCGVPKFFKNLLFDRIDSSKSGKINKPLFSAFWKGEFEKIEVKKRIFRLLAKPGSDYIHTEDFKPMMK